MIVQSKLKCVFPLKLFLKATTQFFVIFSAILVNTAILVDTAIFGYFNQDYWPKKLLLVNIIFLVFSL